MTQQHAIYAAIPVIFTVASENKFAQHAGKILGLRDFEYEDRKLSTAALATGKPFDIMSLTSDAELTANGFQDMTDHVEDVKFAAYWVVTEESDIPIRHLVDDALSITEGVSHRQKLKSFQTPYGSIAVQYMSQTGAAAVFAEKQNILGIELEVIRGNYNRRPV